MPLYYEIGIVSSLAQEEEPSLSTDNEDNEDNIDNVDNTDNGLWEAQVIRRITIQACYM